MRRSGLKKFLTLLTVILFTGSLLLGTAAPARAATSIVVTTTSDQYGTGTACSLREAIVAANTDKTFGGCPAGSGVDSIEIPAGNYQLTRTGSGEDSSATGDLDIRESVTINGAGADITVISVQSTFNDRIFHVKPPLNSDGSIARAINVSISNLKITGADLSAQGGGGLLNDKASLSLYRVAVINNKVGSGMYGGGISNRVGSTLVINQSTLSQNEADYGGAIFNGGTITVNNSLISDNLGEVSGGGVSSNSTSAGGATIVNSTIALNRSGAAGASGGAGLSIAGLMTLINSTIADNEGYGVLIYESATLTIANTLIARHAPQPNCVTYGTVSSKGYNLVDQYNAGDTRQCKFTATGDLVNEDPYLSTDLVDDGSPTHFYSFTLITADNKAVDAVPAGNAYCPPNDQRFRNRPADGNSDGQAKCDIGAYEEGGVIYLSFIPIIRK